MGRLLIIGLMSIFLSMPALVIITIIGLSLSAWLLITLGKYLFKLLFTIPSVLVVLFCLSCTAPPTPHPTISNKITAVDIPYGISTYKVHSCTYILYKSAAGVAIVHAADCPNTNHAH